MQANSPEEPDNELPPPGSRWGMGVESVLPYLARSLQAKPAPPIDGRDGKAGPLPQASDRGPGHRRAG